MTYHLSLITLIKHVPNLPNHHYSNMREGWSNKQTITFFLNHDVIVYIAFLSSVFKISNTDYI